jgi:hypothetical protein
MIVQVDKTLLIFILRQRCWKHNNC